MENTRITVRYIEVSNTEFSKPAHPGVTLWSSSIPFHLDWHLNSHRFFSLQGTEHILKVLHSKRAFQKGQFVAREGTATFVRTGDFRCLAPPFGTGLSSFISFRFCLWSLALLGRFSGNRTLRANQEAKKNTHALPLPIPFARCPPTAKPIETSAAVICSSSSVAAAAAAASGSRGPEGKAEKHGRDGRPAPRLGRLLSGL